MSDTGYRGSMLALGVITATASILTLLHAIHRNDHPPAGPALPPALQRPAGDVQLRREPAAGKFKVGDHVAWTNDDGTVGHGVIGPAGKTFQGWDVEYTHDGKVYAAWCDEAGLRRVP
jgi:hypothetical protein